MMAVQKKLTAEDVARQSLAANPGVRHAVAANGTAVAVRDGERWLALYEKTLFGGWVFQQQTKPDGSTVIHTVSVNGQPDEREWREVFPNQE